MYKVLASRICTNCRVTPDKTPSGPAGLSDRFPLAHGPSSTASRNSGKILPRFSCRLSACLRFQTAFCRQVEARGCKLSGRSPHSLAGLVPFQALGSRSQRRDRARVPGGTAGEHGYHLERHWRCLSSVTTHVGFKNKQREKHRSCQKPPCRAL